MASDPNKPLLRLSPSPASDRPAGRPKPVQKPSGFPQDRQAGAFSPKFERLAEVLGRDPTGLELRSDPTALAPERLLVFELQGSINTFAAAVRKVPGLELVDEEELEQDATGVTPVAYLMVPDVKALRELESLWRRWLRHDLPRGALVWREVFATLRDLRPWGPTDRVERAERGVLSEEISNHDDSDSLRVEVELVYRADTGLGARYESEMRQAIIDQGGTVISQKRINEVAYHALLVELPVPAVRQLVELTPASIAALDIVMHIRAQSVASSLEYTESGAAEDPLSVAELGSPIAALLDGVPLSAHLLLSAHVVIDDQFDLVPNTPVADRVHGTAMASLLVHGDRNRREPPLPRRIHVVPVLATLDQFPADRLIVDMIYTAVLTMKEGAAATARDVLIVNLSLGNRRRPFHGQLSPWARVLDRLAYRFGLLFIVSAGNCPDAFPIKAFATSTAYEDAEAVTRAKGTLIALAAIMGERRLLSPAETINGVTVGAFNEDSVPAGVSSAARTNIDPYGALRMPNPSSALGPGFARSVKPDLLMPGAREHVRLHATREDHIEMRPAGAAGNAGLLVAGPPRAGLENGTGYTGGTSAAAVLASRTAHRIHDALEAAYGDEFRGVPNAQRAVLLKALLGHPALWPADSADLIRVAMGPAGGKHHVRQKDNIRRFLGFGMVDADDAVACAADRATFWATGTLEPNKVAVISVPVPAAIGSKAKPHAISATLAWFTPTAPGRRSYRSVRLKLLEPAELRTLGVTPDKNQPDGNQTNRGTLFTRRWTGRKAPAVGPNMNIELTVQRDPDQGTPIDEPVPYGLAVTLTMPGVLEIYEQVCARLRITPRVST